MPYTNDIEGTQTPDSKQETNNMSNATSKSKKNTKASKIVRVLGHECKVGSKLHAKLIAQLKHFNDLAAN